MSFYLKLATANTLDLLSYVYLMLANAVQLGWVNPPGGPAIAHPEQCRLQRHHHQSDSHSAFRCLPVRRSWKVARSARGDRRLCGHRKLQGLVEGVQTHLFKSPAHCTSGGSGSTCWAPNAALERCLARVRRLSAQAAPRNLSRTVRTGAAAWVSCCPSRWNDWWLRY
eukprot:COSAG05_NODE_387_length_10460_cov_18.410096_4_plen_168_part_00